MKNIRATLIMLCLVVLTIGCASATENQKILILVHGSASEDSELAVIKQPLEDWGYCVDVLDHTEDYEIAHDNVGGDHWFLKDTTGANGHGNLDLVTNGKMNYKVIIFGAQESTSYADIETSARTVKSMFDAYPFLGFVQMEYDYTDGSTNNVFHVRCNGMTGPKILTINNPTGIWALEPIKGYTISLQDY